jgi:hypothetical protein
MSLAEIKPEPYDDAAARKALGKAIAKHQAALGELAAMRRAVKEAGAKLASMQQAIVESELAEIAADALAEGRKVSPDLGAFQAKEKRDKLIADHVLLKTSFARLQERAKDAEATERAAHAAAASTRAADARGMHRAFLFVSPPARGEERGQALAPWPLVQAISPSTPNTQLPTGRDACKTRESL